MGKPVEKDAEMSTVCGEFSENTWKKDLCKNCQRSRAEHNASSGNRGGKPVPTKAKRTSISSLPDGKVPTTTTPLTISKKINPVSTRHDSKDNQKHSVTKISQGNCEKSESSPKQKRRITPKNGICQPDKVLLEHSTNKSHVNSSNDIDKSSKKLPENETKSGTKPIKTVPKKASRKVSEKAPNQSENQQPKSALKSPNTSAKSARVFFQENDPEIIGYNGGEENDGGEDRIESESVISGNVETCLTEEEKQFSLLSLENTRWNADVQNLKMESPLEEKMKRVASKEFEDAELESLWKPDRFPVLKDCDAGKVGTFPLTKKSQLRTSLDDIFSEVSNDRSSSEPEITSCRTSRLSSEPPEGYKTPGSSREISPALDRKSGGSLASSRTSSVSDVDVQVESFRLKKEKKPRVASAYKVVDINPEPVAKPYGIVDVSSGDVPESYPPPELPSTPAPLRSRRSSERSPGRSSVAGDAISVSSTCSSEHDNISQGGTLDRKSRKDSTQDENVPEDMSITMQMLNDNSKDAELKAAIKFLDEVWKEEEIQNGTVEETTQENNPQAQEPPKPVKRGSTMTESITEIEETPQDSLGNEDSSSAQLESSCERGDPTRTSKGKASHAFEAKMASIAANLDLNKQKGKRPAPQPPNSPPPGPPGETPKSPNDVTSQTPDPTFRFVKVGMIPNSAQPASPDLAEEDIPEDESSHSDLREQQESPKTSAKNNEARKSGLMSFFSKFLRRGKETESNGDTITVTAMEDTIKFVDKNACLDETHSLAESSTDEVVESDPKLTMGSNSVKPKISPTPMKYAISDIMEEIYGKSDEGDDSETSNNVADVKSSNDLPTSEIPAMMSKSVNFEDNKIPDIMTMSLTALPSSNPGHSTLPRKEDGFKGGLASPKKSGEGNRKEFRIAENPKQGQKSPDISQVRRRVRSPTKREAPRPVTAPRGLDNKNPLFAKELELRLSKGGPDTKASKPQKTVETKKLPAPEPPMSPKSPTPSLELKKEACQDIKPVTTTTTSVTAATSATANNDQELYLPPWESRACEKIELPCQKGRRSLLGRIGGQRKTRPPAPPPPGPVKASVKRAKSITESSLPGDIKKIDRSDISGPILIKGSTTAATTSTKPVNRRNTISLGDDSSYASGGSSSQDSGSGSIGSKRSYDDPPEPPSLSPLGSLENLYEPIGPRSKSMITSLEGYLEPVVASGSEPISTAATITTKPEQKEEPVEAPKKILSLEEERELFLCSQPIYEEIPNSDGRREELYPEIKIKPKKKRQELQKQMSSPTTVIEIAEVHPVPQEIEKAKERPPSQPSSREGTPKPAIRSQTLPRPAPRSKCGDKLSPEGTATTPAPFPIHGPPPATGPPGQNRPRPVPRRKPQILAKPSTANARKSTVEQYVAMNRPACSTKNYSLECLRENFNKMTGTNFESLQQILKDTESDLLDNNPVVKGTMRWTTFRLCQDSPLFTSNKCVVYQATLPELKSDSTIFQLMIFPKSPHENSQAITHVNWINVLAAFTDSIPVKFLSESLLQVWKLPREMTNQDQGGRVKVHIVVTRYHTYEFLNDYFYSLQETMQVTSDAYYQHFVFVLVQCFCAFLFSLERGYSLSNIGLQDMNIVSLTGMTGKFISVWPKLRAIDNGSSPEDGICGNAKRVMQELILSFTCIDQKFPPRFESAMDRVTELLQEENIECLSVARAVLEFSLWGPEGKTLDDIMNSNTQEQSFDMWIEVERAALVNKFARESTRRHSLKSVEDFYKMKFFLKSNGASMVDVAKQLWRR